MIIRAWTPNLYNTMCDVCSQPAIMHTRAHPILGFLCPDTDWQPVEKRKCKRCKNMSLRTIVHPDSSDEITFCRLCGQEGKV